MPKGWGQEIYHSPALLFLPALSNLQVPRNLSHCAPASPNLFKQGPRPGEKQRSRLPKGRRKVGALTLTLPQGDLPSILGVSRVVLGYVPSLPGLGASQPTGSCIWEAHLRSFYCTAENTRNLCFVFVFLETLAKPNFFFLHDLKCFVSFLSLSSHSIIFLVHGN